MSEFKIGAVAREAGVGRRYGEGDIVFRQGEAGDCMFVIQSGTIELNVDGTTVDICGENETIGYMSIIDGSERSSTAVAKSDVEVSVLTSDHFYGMVDEVPGFAVYVMTTMAQRIRGMAKAIDFLFT